MPRGISPSGTGREAASSPRPRPPPTPPPPPPPPAPPPRAPPARGGAPPAPAPVTTLPPLTDPACAPIAELLRDPAVRKGGHNIKYDWQVLRKAGVELAGVAYDSMPGGFVLGPARRSHGIDTLSLDHLQRPMRSYTDLTGKGKAEIPFAEVAVADAGAYCGADRATVLSSEEFFAPRPAAWA